MIEIRDITKTYTVDGQAFKAVDNVSFAVSRGEMVSIIGHSGSGKTTLLSLIGGLTRPDSGEVVIDGVSLRSMNDDTLSEFRNKKMNFIYQFSSLIPTLTTIENVMLPTAFGNFSDENEGYARELIRTVGLEDRMNSYPSHLSGGQQRRVAIARAFVNSPEIILADEPTGDLDEDTEKEVIRLFHRMNEERGITFILVTHNREIADQAKKHFRMTNGVLSEI